MSRLVRVGNIIGCDTLENYSRLELVGISVLEWRDLNMISLLMHSSLWGVGEY